MTEPDDHDELRRRIEQWADEQDGEEIEVDLSATSSFCLTVPDNPDVTVTLNGVELEPGQIIPDGAVIRITVDVTEDTESTLVLWEGEPVAPEINFEVADPEPDLFWELYKRIKPDWYEDN